MTFNKILLLLILSILTSIQAQRIPIYGNETKMPKIWLENNQAEGILIEIMKYADSKLPENFEYELYPWARAFYNAENGFGGIVGISKTEERLESFDYSIPIYDDEIILVVKKGNEFEFNTLEDLRGLVVGVCRDCIFGPVFIEAANYFIVDEDKDSIQRLRKLLVGRIDAALINPGEAGLNIEIKNASGLSRDQFSIIEKPLVVDPNFLAFEKSMNMKEFLERFNKIIEEGYASGDIQMIIAGYILEVTSN